MTRRTGAFARLVGAILLASLASCATQTFTGPGWIPSSPDRGQEHVSMALGIRSFSSEDWSPLEDQALIRVGYQLQPIGAPLSLDLALGYSQEDTRLALPSMEDVRLRAGVWEASAGFYKEFGGPRYAVHPYLGVGLSLLVINRRLADPGAMEFPSEDNASLASYARAGLLWQVYPGAQVGLDLRFTGAGDVRFGDMRIDGDSFQVGILFRGSM